MRLILPRGAPCGAPRAVQIAQPKIRPRRRIAATHMPHSEHREHHQMPLVWSLRARQYIGGGKELRGAPAQLFQIGLYARGRNGGDKRVCPQRAAMRLELLGAFERSPGGTARLR